MSDIARQPMVRLRDGEREATAFGPTVPKGDYPPQYATLFPEVVVKAASDLVAEVQTAPDPARWGSLALSLLPFAPVVDGSVVPAAPLSAFASGQGGEVPLLIGSNRDEARLFLVAAGTIDLIDPVTLGAVAAAYGLPDAGLAVYSGNRPADSAGDVL
jgi:para-nitrobenzyl esterase